jgi:hypothetical protein
MKKIYTILILLLIGSIGFAQVAINEDDSDADPNAALDVKSTTKGVIIPKLSESQRDTLKSPAPGLLIYNRTFGYFNYFNGTKWNRIPRTVAVDPAVNPSSAGTDKGVGVGIEDPDNSAILHINSNKKGLLMPVLGSDIAGAPEGMIYSQNGNFFRYYDGTEWKTLLGPNVGDPDNNPGTAEGTVIGKATIDESAKMEIYSTDKGLLLPRMTDAQRDAIESPAEGLLIYNTTTSAFQYYTDLKWYEWISDASTYGDTEGQAARNCLDILNARPTATDGTYWIDPDGGAGANDPFECHCDMTTAGGGWMRVNYYDFAGTTDNGTLADERDSLIAQWTTVPADMFTGGCADDSDPDQFRYATANVGPLEYEKSGLQLYQAQEARFYHNDETVSYNDGIATRIEYDDASNTGNSYYDGSASTGEHNGTYNQTETYSASGDKIIDTFFWHIDMEQANCGDSHIIYSFYLLLR